MRCHDYIYLFGPQIHVKMLTSHKELSQNIDFSKVRMLKGNLRMIKPGSNLWQESPVNTIVKVRYNTTKAVTWLPKISYPLIFN